MKIAIIGAGGAGLCAGRHCLEANFHIDIFEQTGNVGGTWNYTDYIGFDENGIPVHSSMYKGLRTNLPKEVMAYEDFPYPQQEESYLPQEQVLSYIQNYSKKFQIDSHVKFYTQVLFVEPIGKLWKVNFQDVKTKQKASGLYDAVIVCNGHYMDAIIPEIPGADSFPGNVKHSHDYREPSRYKNRRVLLLGAGPSGTDISQQISQVATKVFLSHKSPTALPISDLVTQKPIVRGLDGNLAIFEDGSTEEIDDILFCTGYRITFPFLSNKCGITVQENCVHPLYKHVINIQNPTMAFIGIPIRVCPFPLFDIQVRFFLSTLKGHFKLPPKEQMLEDLNQYVSKLKTQPLRKYHELGETQGVYFDELADTANIKRVAPVIDKIYQKVRLRRNTDDCFRILDEENFVQIR